jgi:hypothetical protein
LASQPVRLGGKYPSGAKDQIINTVRCRFNGVGRALSRGRIWRLQLPLVLAGAVILGSGFRDTYGHVLLSQTRDSSNHVPIFMYLGNGVAQLYPQAWVPDLAFTYRLFPSNSRRVGLHNSGLSIAISQYIKY